MTRNFTEIVFGLEEAHEVPEMDQGSLEATMRVGARPYLVAASGTPPDLFLTPTPLIYTQTFRKKPRSAVPPPQAYVATENQSRPILAPCRRGESLSGGHVHHPSALHDEEGVSPSGLRVCTSSYVFDLSLSLSCS